MNKIIDLVFWLRRKLGKMKDWIEEHTYQTSPYWTILPTMQVGEKVYLYWLKWGVRF